MARKLCSVDGGGIITSSRSKQTQTLLIDDFCGYVLGITYGTVHTHIGVVFQAGTVSNANMKAFPLKTRVLHVPTRNCRSSITAHLGIIIFC